MTNKELSRLEIVQKIKDKRLKQKEAANALNLSIVQIKRLYKAFRKEGAKGLISKKRGAASNNRLPEKLRQEALGLIMENYVDFGPTLAHEKLSEIHHLPISISSIRNLMIEYGVWQSRRARKKIVHQMRQRRSRIGELIQIDGSPHDWFEGRAPKCCLLLFIDDATSAILEAEFVNSETTFGYMRVAKRHILKYGRPLAYYSDKHGIFKVNQPTLSQSGLTQFGRALKELDIQLLCANSPQAKGRVERANGILQDRLPKNMRLQNISNIEDANLYLPSFIEDYNQRFAKVPQDPNNAHRSILSEMDLDHIFTIKQKRNLSKNLTFQYQNKIYQIKTNRPSYALRKADVMVLENEHGEVFVEYKGKSLQFTVYEERPLQSEEVDSKRLNEAVDRLVALKKYKPSRRHPWKRRYPKTLCVGI